MQINLAVLKADRHIMFTHVFDEEGRRFTSYFLDNLMPPAEFGGVHSNLALFPLVREQLGDNPLPENLPSQGIYQFEKQFVDVVRQIAFNGKVIGAVYIRSDLTAFNQRLLWTWAIATIIFMISIALAFVLTLYVQRALKNKTSSAYFASTRDKNPQVTLSQKNISHIVIQKKLRRVIVIVNGSVLFLSSIYFIFNEFIEFRRSMLENLFVYTEVVAINSTPGLLFQDQESVRMELATLKFNRHILLSYVFDKEGEHFASYFSDNRMPPVEPEGIYSNLKSFSLIRTKLAANVLPMNLPTEGLYQFHKQFVEVVRQVAFGDKVIGAVYLRSDLTAFNDRLLWTGSIVTIGFIMSMVLVFVLASYSQRVITMSDYQSDNPD